VYAFNWYNVGAVLPLIGSALGATTPELGVVLGGFLAGAGVFQLPAGLAAMRWGNRTVSIAALVIMGAFSLASAFSPNWMVLAALRFGAGAGAAFFFAPALGLVTSYYPVGSRGPVIGIYNAGFSLGSGVGLFAGAFLGAALGWSWALAIGGIGLLAAAAIAPLVLPRTEVVRAFRSMRGLWAASRPVLRSRDLWALALS
jgi:AAHS family 4-hydroxybenzoate transporter-like MFS transporter